MDLDNTTEELSCVIQTLTNVSYEEKELPSVLTKTTGTVLLIYLPAIILVGFCLNILGILLVPTTKKLRTVFFIIATQIMCLDLAFAIIEGVSLLTSVAGGGWVLGARLCLGASFIGAMLGFIRTSSLSALALDSFFYIFAPISYPKKRKKVVGLLLLLSWLVGVVVSALPLPGIFDCYGYQQEIHMCLFASSCNSTCKTSSFIFWIFILVPPFLLPVVLYILIFWKARELKLNRISRSQVDFGVTVTFFLIFLCSLLFIIPLNIVMSVLHHFTKSEIVDHITSVFNASVMFFIIVVDPLFILCNRKVKEALKMKMKMKCFKNSEANRVIPNIGLATEYETRL